ncbi:hypothetical protein EUX98_g405 [Antrodiella citrinella]|uniref:Uncharacterized protein n=1 Tax=Antrodiella citrinella TaxID=2447956 RepID=A0A4S4N433_9APHY|nr:hypothetical protein EUX98_g405 [Antrodiella citrinella]
MITGTRCAKRLRLATHTPIASTSVLRALHTSSSRQVALALPLNDVFSPPQLQPTLTIRQKLDRQKFQDFEQALQRPLSCNFVWATYVELINFVGIHNVPLEIHQKALRRCTADPDQARVDHAKRFMSRGGNPFAPHIHEPRFKAILQNIREAGFIPALEDYHVILRQFAAIGYHYGALRVLREIPTVNLQPTSKTYGLCLQTLCHRISLPCPKEGREKVLEEAVALSNEITREMHANQVPFTATTTNLLYRLLNKTMNMESLTQLLKIAYGVDLSYPDRPPLEFWAGAQQAEGSTKRDPLPFSTSALNTTVNVLGRLRDVSKLVQTFEVLTTSLPSGSGSAPASSYEDDEDEDFGVDRPAVASFPPPHAEPNTYTYETLLKHIGHARHHVFARHYLLQAMRLDQEVDRALRKACRSLPERNILAPTFSVNRRMLLSVFSFAASQKKMEMLRWVHVKTQKVLRRKKADLRFYTSTRARWTTAAQAATSAVPAASDAGSDGEASHADDTPAVIPTTSHDASPSKPKFTISKAPHFDVDLDSEAPPSEPPRKKFDINLHIKLLQRDVDQLEVFERHVRDVVGRNTQRIKERLTRRVWNGQSVYMRISNRQVRIEPSMWVDAVNFRETRAVEGGVGVPKKPKVKQRILRPGNTRAVGYFTSSSPE